MGPWNIGSFLLHEWLWSLGACLLESKFLSSRYKLWKKNIYIFFVDGK
jgi:hypothetical protein